MLVTAIETQQAGLVEELGARQAEAERRAEELLNELEQEIEELQTRSSELHHLELTQNPLHLLQVRHPNCISTFLSRVDISRPVLNEEPMCLPCFRVSRL